MIYLTAFILPVLCYAGLVPRWAVWCQFVGAGLYLAAWSIREAVRT